MGLVIPGPYRIKSPEIVAEEQQFIADTLDAVENKIACASKKRAALTDLFRTLPRQLMRAQIGVHDLDLDELTANARVVA